MVFDPLQDAQFLAFKFAFGPSSDPTTIIQISIYSKAAIAVFKMSIILEQTTIEFVLLAAWLRLTPPAYALKRSLSP